MIRGLKLNNRDCSNHCHDPRQMKLHDVRLSHRNSWNLGYWRCRNCEVYIKDGKPTCFCCSRRMAIRPRNAKSRRMLVDSLDIKRY